MINVSIEGTDRTRFVNGESLKIVQVITSHPDQCFFIVRKFGSRTYVPMVDEEVIITQDGSKIFAGNILEVEEVYEKLGDASYKVKCIDYTRSIDNSLVVETFKNKTVNEIIQTIRDTYLPGAITINNVDVSDSIETIKFNYEYPSRCLQILAERVGADWYIDYDKDIHFFKQLTKNASFNLDDTGGKYIYDSLVVRKDISQLRNTIIVRGGEYLGDTITAEYVGDGIQDTFYVPYKLEDLSLVTTGQARSVGTDPTDDPSKFDAIHNIDEKFIKFRSDKIPRDLSTISIGGTPRLPVIVKMRSDASISSFTAREHIVVDKSITSRDEARQRAAVELLNFASTLSEADFDTYQEGLHTGQKITISSDLRGISSDEYVINRIITRAFGTKPDGSTQLIHEVQLITTRKYDYIRLLQDLINSFKQKVEIADDEVLEQIFQFGDEMSLSDTMSAQPPTTGPYVYFTADPGANENLIWDFGTWTS